MSLNQTKITVVVPTRNRAARLKRMLDALLQDNYQNKEIIVRDAMSTDGTQELLRSYGDQIRWVSEPDLGEFDARNKGLQTATGDIIRYLSDDDVPVPGGLAYAADYFARNPQVDILFGQAVIFYERANGDILPVDTRPRTAESVQLRNFIRNLVPYPPSETAFYRRSVIGKIGFFDTVRGADHEYWARAAKAGLKLEVCDQIVLHYYRSSVNEIQSAKAYTQLIFARWVLASRYGTWRDRLYVMIVVIPRLLILDSLRRYLPPWMVFPLRRARWRWMNR